MITEYLGGKLVAEPCDVNLSAAASGHVRLTALSKAAG
jgi:hypothetical protein